MSIFGQTPVKRSGTTLAIEMAASALNMFTVAVEKLTQSNNIAQEVVAKNTEEIKEKTAENDHMTMVIVDNTKIINNINNLLGNESEVSKE